MKKENADGMYFHIPPEELSERPIDTEAIILRLRAEIAQTMLTDFVLSGWPKDREG